MSRWLNPEPDAEQVKDDAEREGEREGGTPRQESLNQGLTRLVTLCRGANQLTVGNEKNLRLGGMWPCKG